MLRINGGRMETIMIGYKMSAEKQLKILLICRGVFPYKGYWALREDFADQVRLFYRQRSVSK